jgi:hypothetical protein
VGKHQKPKPASAKGVQKNHNKATKGNNTRKKGAVWAVQSRRVKDKTTGEEREVRYEVRVPKGLGYDPELASKKNLPEPLDTIHLDWAEELAAFVARTDGKLYREALPGGRFEYRVRDVHGNIVFSVISSRNAFIDHRPRRKRRRGRKK